MRIVVLSSFWLDGQAHPEDSVLEVPDRLGLELIHNHKAARAPVVDKPAGELVAEPAAAGRARRAPRDTQKETP